MMSNKGKKKNVAAKTIVASVIVFFVLYAFVQHEQRQQEIENVRAIAHANGSPMQYMSDQEIGNMIDNLSEHSSQ